MVDLKDKGDSLESYSLEELKNTILPSGLALHPHSIRVEEGNSEYSQTMDNLVQVTAELNDRLGNEKCAFGGSMAMYLLWNDLMEKYGEIDIREILNQRIRGGKNDYDLTLELGRKNIVMKDKLGFKNSEIQKERGKVANQMIDVLSRPEKKNFPNREISIGEQEFDVQNPYDSLFEKLSALAYPQVDEFGKEREKEVKWGVDVKLYKLYLQLSEKLSEEQLNERLVELWGKYKKERREIGAEEIASEMNSGKNAREIVGNMFRMSFSSDEELISKSQELYPKISIDLIRDLIGSVDKQSFIANIMKVYEVLDKDSDSYLEMHRKAEDNFRLLLKSSKSKGNHII